MASQAIPISALLADSPSHGETTPPRDRPAPPYQSPREPVSYAARYYHPHRSADNSPTIYHHAPQLPQSRSEIFDHHNGGYMPLQSRQPQHYAHHHPTPAHSPQSSARSSLSDPYLDTRRSSDTADRPAPPELQYTLHIRQQPEAARACGFGERDRRVVDPPPIVEMQATLPSGEDILVKDGYTTLHVILLDAGTGADASQMPVGRAAAVGETQTLAQRLMGCSVTSPFLGEDERGRKGSFFVFSDLSVRQAGVYRLRFRLLRVDPLDRGRGGRWAILKEAESAAFEVFSAKEFPGMKASSPLLKALRRQGLNVGVKKGKEGREGRGTRDGESDSEEERKGKGNRSKKARRG